MVPDFWNDSGSGVGGLASESFRTTIRGIETGVTGRALRGKFSSIKHLRICQWWGLLGLGCTWISAVLSCETLWNGLEA